MKRTLLAAMGSVFVVVIVAACGGAEGRSDSDPEITGSLDEGVSACCPSTYSLTSSGFCCPPSGYGAPCVQPSATFCAPPPTACCPSNYSLENGYCCPPPGYGAPCVEASSTFCK